MSHLQNQSISSEELYLQVKADNGWWHALRSSLNLIEISHHAVVLAECLSLIGIHNDRSRRMNVANGHCSQVPPMGNSCMVLCKACWLIKGRTSMVGE